MTEQSHSSQMSRNRARMSLLLGPHPLHLYSISAWVNGVVAHSQDCFFPLAIPLWKTPQKPTQQCVLLST